jgi:hypothetical protein
MRDVKPRVVIVGGDAGGAEFAARRLGWIEVRGYLRYAVLGRECGASIMPPFRNREPFVTAILVMLEPVGQRDRTWARTITPARLRIVSLPEPVESDTHFGRISRGCGCNAAIDVCVPLQFPTR